MKAQGFKKTVFAAGMIVLGLNFTACVEYTAPLCSADKLQDIEGLEGTHTQHFVDQDFKMKMQTIEVVRDSEGSYFSGAVKACSFGSNQIIQAKTKHGTYKVMAVNTSPTGLSFAALVVGAEELEQAGIRYQIVERTEQEQFSGIPRGLLQSLPMKSLNEVKERVMVVDNSAPDSNLAIRKYAVPYSLGIITK